MVLAIDEDRAHRQLRLRVDLVLLPRPADLVVGHLNGEVLIHFFAADVAPHPPVDRLLAAQPRVRGAHGAGDRLQDALRRAQQVLALAGALVSQTGVEADQQALAGKVRAAGALQEALEAKLTADAEDGGDMAMGQGAAAAEGLLAGAIDLAAAEHGADALDDLGELLRLGMTSTW